MSLIYYQQNENAPLLSKKENTNLTWTEKLFKWPFSTILIGVSILGAIYLLYFAIVTKLHSDFNDTTKTSCPLHVSSIATTNDDYQKHCAPPVKCDPSMKYRSLNGYCNNLKRPTWGASKTPFHRMMNANYNDGNYEVRLQSNGSALPSPRVVNLELFLTREQYRVDENNVLLLPFGQLLAHDISGMEIDAPENQFGVVTDCCDDENAKKTFSQCQMVVENPIDDPVYSKRNITCMGLLRCQTSANYSCPLQPASFFNGNTQFIDASEVYGSNEDTALRLRAMEGGRLNFSTGDNGQMFCPFIAQKQNDPIENHNNHFRYDTGDQNNGNQNLGITSMQILFLRFHNYMAFKLSSINPHWSDEILFQETRRIIIATIQRIAYEDFLPIIIGADFHEMYGLNEENIYDPNVNPSMSLEMSSAAFRVLHTIIPVQFNFMDRDYKIEYAVNVTDWMVKPDFLPLGYNYDKLLKGFLETPGRIAQPSYNFYISNFMFNLPFKAKYIGVDLMSSDIVRGRDVGLQPYNQVRHLCGYPLAEDFEDLVDLMHIKDISKLKELYHSVNDIDLMVGMLLERLSDGAIVGPTARCLITDGFYRFKAGDRFFYDVQGQPGSFTPDQLKIIKKITLGHVLCATTNLDHVQKDIFKTVDHNLFPTSKLKCDDNFNLYFNEWEEQNNKSEL